MEILIAEDDPVAGELLAGVLEQLKYRVTIASDGMEALDKLRDGTWNVVISDWNMPRMDGIDLCRAIRSENLGRYVYVILLTIREGSKHMVEGLSAGADEFMSKPFSPEELSVRLRTAERILSLEGRDMMIFALAKLAESRDTDTGTHLERVQDYCEVLATRLSTKEKFHSIITPLFINMIRRTSPLHDIGKVGIPDHVLLKPGSLTTEEFEIMKSHTSIGADTLNSVLVKHPSGGFLEMARDIAACHHERIDGKGYPLGLAGEDIPLAARIFSIADVYDALISKRVYKAAFSHEMAVDIIVKGSGTQFDSDVVEGFLEIEREFKHIALKAIED